MKGNNTIKTNSEQVLSLLEKIKKSQDRKLNKLGEWMKKGKESLFVFDEKDLKYILK